MSEVATCPVAEGYSVIMWAYALWGVFGGFAVEALEFVAAIRRTGGWPWRQSGEPGALPLLVSVILRLSVSAGLAAALAASHQLSGVFAAVAVGAGAPLIIEQLARQVSVSSVSHEPQVHSGKKVDASGFDSLETLPAEMRQLEER
jgi:hypothetical protein